MDQDEINEVLEDALDDDYMGAYVAFTYAQNVSEANLVPRFMRTSITFAGPIETETYRHYSTEDREEVQTEYHAAFARWVQEQVDQNFPEARMGCLVDTYSFLTLEDEFLALLAEDGFLSVAAMLFVGVYIAIHLRSCCLACVGISLILLSFPFAVFVTSAVF